jgi:membrane protein YdbS with pleckstrin-like domain
MKLTPVYNPALIFWRTFLALFFMVIPLALATTPIMLATNFSYFYSIIASVGALWIIATLILMHLIKRNYAQTYYELEEDKIIYFDGFFSLTRKEILYKRIMEVNLSQGFLQKKYGLGNIILVTSSASSNQASAGITIRDIENSEQAYEAAKKLIYPHIRAN